MPSKSDRGGCTAARRRLNRPRGLCGQLGALHTTVATGRRTRDWLCGSSTLQDVWCWFCTPCWMFHVGCSISMICWMMDLLDSFIMVYVCYICGFVWYIYVHLCDICEFQLYNHICDAKQKKQTKILLIPALPPANKGSRQRILCHLPIKAVGKESSAPCQ